MRSPSVVCFIGASLLASGCAAPLEAPSAYASEQFLCGSEHAAEWDALVSACNEHNGAARACAGVVSLRGEIDGETFVANSLLPIAVIAYDESKPALAGELLLDGQSSYFKFRVSAEALFEETTSGSPGPCGSGSTNLFGMEVRGSSNLQRMNFNHCELASRPSGLYLSFSASFTKGGFLDGCTQVPHSVPHP